MVKSISKEKSDFRKLTDGYLEGFSFSFEFFDYGGEGLWVHSIFDKTGQDRQCTLVEPAIQNL